MLARINHERGFNSPLTWLDTFNALGGIAPFIRSLWNQWWLLDTPGKAVCALQYAAHLIYPVEVNPLWPEGSWQWQPPLGATKEPWLENNLAFLTRQLTSEMILDGVQKAAEMLRDEPESAMATRISRDALAARTLSLSRLRIFCRLCRAANRIRRWNNVRFPASSAQSALVPAADNVREYDGQYAELRGSWLDRAANQLL